MHQHPGFYNMDAPYFQGVNPKETILESWGVLKDYVNQILPAGGRQWHLAPSLSDSRPVLDALSEQQMPSVTRQEVITKLLSTCFGLAVSFSITYFGIKWLVNAMDPTREEKRQAHRRAMKLMKSIGVSDKVKLTEYELCIASDLVDPLGMVVSWENIGGLEGTINEILETVILPFHDNLLASNSSLVQPPKGVLLYGPPGCGKTMIAKATAKAAGARFVNLQVSTLVDKWYGESQKRVEAVFSLAVKLQPTIIFIDEIDSFMRTRNSTDHEATAMMKTQFMSFWDGLMTDTSCRVMIMGATNRPQDVDAAILRRMPSMFYVGLPELVSREQILNLILSNEPVEDEVSLKKLAERTQGYSGSDLRELCRNAAIYRLREYSQRRRLAKMQGDSGTNDLEEDPSSLRHVSMGDFEKAFNKMKQSKFLTPMPMRYIDVE